MFRVYCLHAWIITTGKSVLLSASQIVLRSRILQLDCTDYVMQALSFPLQIRQGIQLKQWHLP